MGRSEVLPPGTACFVGFEYMILILKTFIPVFYNQRLKLKVEVYITLQKKIGKNVHHFLPLLECMCSRQVL